MRVVPLAWSSVELFRIKGVWPLELSWFFLFFRRNPCIRVTDIRLLWRVLTWLSIIDELSWIFVITRIILGKVLLPSQRNVVVSIVVSW